MAAFDAISMKFALVSAPASTSHRYTFLCLRITLNQTSTLSNSSLYLPYGEEGEGRCWRCRAAVQGIKIAHDNRAIRQAELRALDRVSQGVGSRVIVDLVVMGHDKQPLAARAVG